MEGEGVANIEMKKTISGKEKSPFEIIPKECWDKVFEKLNVEDLRSCREVCKSFRDIADWSKFKVKWKFDKVLPLLMPYLETNAPEARFSWENLHKIRLTCVAWRESVDKYATETGAFKSPTSSSHPIPLMTPFQSLEDLEEFQEKFGDCKTNPFPARTVYIENYLPADLEAMYDDRRYEEFRENVKTFQAKYIEKIGDLLQHFGRHIFKLHLNFGFEEYRYSCSALALCKFMKKITTYLPNLKEFLIDNLCEATGADFKQEIANVATYIEENQLAGLPNLEKLWIGQLDKAVANFLLNAYAPQLKDLKRTDYYSPLRDDSPLNEVHMKQLKNLRNLDLTCSPGDTLKEFKFLQAPLKFLRVTCSFFASLEDLIWKVDEVLLNINKLPIEDLDIRLAGQSGEFVAMAESGIPLAEYVNESVKTFRFEILGGRDGFPEYEVSFDFLQAFWKLKKLTISFDPVPPTAVFQPRPKRQVDLFQCMIEEEWKERMCESNVWEKVPSLKTLRVWRGDDESIIFRE